MNESINHEAVYRTALATPGLFIIGELWNSGWDCELWVHLLLGFKWIGELFDYGLNLTLWVTFWSMDVFRIIGLNFELLGNFWVMGKLYIFRWTFDL